MSDSESECDSILSDWPPLDIYVDGELSDDQDATITDPDQSLSEEQTYRETMRGIRSFIGWMYIPDIDSSASKSEDNPFAGPKLQTPGKVSVQLPTDEWLCRKLSKLNLTLVEGYPSHSSEAGGLQKDQFVQPARSQSKWYGLHSEQKKDTADSVTSWNTNSSRLNSTYLRIARQAGIASNPPVASHLTRKPMQMGEIC